MSEILTRVATLELERKQAGDGPSSFLATLSTDNPVPRRDAFGPFNEVLDHSPGAVDLSRQPVPLLVGHDRSGMPIGQVTGLRLEGGKLKGTVVLGKSARAQEIAADIAAALVPASLSIGYAITASSRSQDGGTLTATSWVLLEASLVAVPADPGAGVGRSFRSSQTQEKKMEGSEEQNVSEAPAVRAERERVSGIRHACKTARLGDEFANRLIRDNTPLSGAREQVLAALVERQPEINGNHAVGIEVGEGESEKMLRGMENALIARAGQATIIAAAAASKVPAARKLLKGFDLDGDDGGDFRARSVLELARMCLERGGRSVRGRSREQIIGDALTMRSGGEHTESDFAVVLENVMYKTLLGNYAIQQDTWRRWCGVEQVESFKPSNRYRLGSFGVLDKVAEGGEFHNKAIPDGVKFSITVETIGNIISISRKALLDDDMGALASQAANFGRAAGLSLEKAAYDLLAQNTGLGPTMSDTLPFFDASRANISTGSALAMAAIELDRVALASQKDPSNNEYLGLRPRALLVPLTLEGEANVINRAKFDPTAASALERPNIVGGLFQDVVGTPRLTGTRRYLFADPGICPAFVMAFLGSGEAPFIDQRMGFRVDGVEWKVRLDAMCQAFDPKGAITNAGA